MYNDVIGISALNVLASVKKHILSNVNIVFGTHREGGMIQIYLLTL